jgi:hypothetical protein
MIILKSAYAKKTGQIIPMYGVKSKSLHDFMTTQKDLEKGISRIPLQLARLPEEDEVKIP